MAVPLCLELLLKNKIEVELQFPLSAPSVEEGWGIRIEKVVLNQKSLGAHESRNTLVEKDIFKKIVVFSFVLISVERYKLMRAGIFIILVSKWKSITGNSIWG